MKVLFVEGDSARAQAVADMLVAGGTSGYEVTHVGDMASAAGLVRGAAFDVVLLGLTLPGSDQVETLIRMHLLAPEVPIVVIIGRKDDELSLLAMQKGADDCLVEDECTAGSLMRAIRYAVERQRLMSKLAAMSLIDELTGLYNRRGFMKLAEQQLKLAARAGRKMVLLYLDVDGIRGINDTLGYQEGDVVLMTLAKVLRGTFRSSDVVARIGGDEFAVLAIDADRRDAASLVARLRDRLRAENATAERRRMPSVSVGWAAWDPADPCLLEELVARADKSMCEDKRSRHA